jgi:hypothetical protein
MTPPVSLRKLSAIISVLENLNSSKSFEKLFDIDSTRRCKVHYKKCLNSFCAVNLPDYCFSVEIGSISSKEREEERMNERHVDKPVIHFVKFLKKRGLYFVLFCKFAP